MTRSGYATNLRNAAPVRTPSDHRSDSRPQPGTPPPSAAAPGDTSGSRELLTIEQLCEWLQVPKQTVYKWRSHGGGPRGFRIGRHVRFAASDVRAWLDEQRDT